MKAILQVLTVVALGTAVGSAYLSTDTRVQNDAFRSSEVEMWTGEVVDLACYVTEDATGAKNAECHKAMSALLAPSEVKNGQPMGLLTDDGTLVLLVPSAKAISGGSFEQLTGSVGETATAKGQRHEHNGVSVLVVE